MTNYCGAVRDWLFDPLRSSIKIVGGKKRFAAIVGAYLAASSVLVGYTYKAVDAHAREVVAREGLASVLQRYDYNKNGTLDIGEKASIWHDYKSPQQERELGGVFQ